MLHFEKNEKYRSIAFYAACAIVASVLIIFFILKFSTVLQYINSFLSILTPFILGFMFAYLCNPIVNFFEKKVFKFSKSTKDRRKLRRVLSMILAYITVIALISVVIYAVLPQAIASFNDLGSNLTKYISSIQGFADKLVSKYSGTLFGEHYDNLSLFLDAHDISFSLQDIISNSYTTIQNGLNAVINYSGQILSGVFDVVLGTFLSIYFLFSKERICAQIKKLLAAITSRRTYINVIRVTRYTHKTCGGFLVAKVIDSIIIGIFTFLILLIFRVPYYPLLAVVIGITNLVPTFGPIIGGAVGGILILLTNPSSFLIFVIIDILIQQIDGNIIGPKIMGNTVGMSAMWVIIAIIAAGGFFGFIGMLIGVPITAVVYVLLKQWCEKRLKHKKLPFKSAFYMNDPPEAEDIDNGPVILDKDTPIPDIVYEETFDDYSPVIIVDKDTAWKKISRRIKNAKNKKRK